MLRLVLVKSDCGVTAERGVYKSVNTSAAHICEFCETKALSKNAKCDAYALFLWHKQSHSASRRSAWNRIFLKMIFTDSCYFRPKSFRLPRPGSGISWKYVRITCSLATRRTLGIPKLLKCINKAQPEPCYEKSQLRSHAYENTAPEPEPFHFCQSHFVFTRASPYEVFENNTFLWGLN